MRGDRPGRRRAGGHRLSGRGSGSERAGVRGLSRGEDGCRRGHHRRHTARPGWSLAERVSVRAPAHPVLLLRGELAAAGRRRDRSRWRERRLLRACDGPGGARALRGGCAAARGNGPSSAARRARASRPRRRRRANPTPGERRGDAAEGTPEGRGRPLSRGIDPCHPRSVLRRRGGRPVCACQRPAGRRRPREQLCGHRFGKDRRRRMHVALGERHRARPYSLGPPA